MARPRKREAAEARLGRKAVQGLLIGAGAAAAALALAFAGLLEGFEARTWDMRVRLFARPAATSSQIALVLLDQASLDWGRETNGLSWPWPREVYSYVVDFARRGGARVIVFDVLFSEPSTYGVEDDAALARSVAESGRFVAAIFPGIEGSAVRWPENLPEEGLSVQGLDSWLERVRPKSFSFQRASFPIPELAASAAVLGNVNFAPDPDGIYRRAGFLARFDGRLLPSIALGAYLAGARTAPRIAIEPGALTIDDRRIPIDSEGRAVLRYRGTGAYAAYSAAAVIQSEVQIREGAKPNLDPSLLRDRYVFFGFSAPGLLDLRPSPVSGVAPGVEINATMLDNILAGDFIAAPSAFTLALLTAGLALASGVASSLARGVAQNIAAYALLLPLPVAAAVAAYPLLGAWLPLAAPELAVVVALTGDSLANYATEGRQKRYLKNAFRQYLSPAVIEQLIAHPERLRLGGERRELTIFFSDLQGFTGLSEGLEPEELTALLNDYLSAMTDIIQEEGGTIDKYEGDAIIAFWNAPLDQPDHALRGVRAALRCQRRLAELRPVFRQRVGKDLFKRIGLNTGPAVVGNMGSRTRFDYTMLGDAVNLASRLEGVNKQFGTYTMMSRATRDAAGAGFAARELGRVAVVGRREPVTVYEPMFPEDAEAARGRLEIFARGLAAYYEGAFAEAERAFASIADQDPPAARYAARCRELAASPPEAWDGVWVMSSK